MPHSTVLIIMNLEESEEEFLERIKQDYYEERFFLDLKLGPQIEVPLVI